MSVDYYPCNYCGDTFCDCGDYVSCEGCGTRWCGDKCAEKDGYIAEHCKLGKDISCYRPCEDCDLATQGDCYDCENYVGASCKWCRQEDYGDDTLLNYALKLLNINRKELIGKYKDASC